MPEDKLDFKATPEVRSFAFDIKHMVGGNYGMMSNALGVEAPKFDAESIKTKAEKCLRQLLNAMTGLLKV